jgi:ribosomal protein S18 acetylase RimI-like enzyme
VIDDRRQHERSQGPPDGGPCIYRRATPADHDVVVALVFDTLRSFGIEPEPDGIDADVMRFGADGDPAIAEFVAELKGRVIGSVALRDRGDGTGHVSKFFVDDRARGRGVGRKLLELAVGEARRRSLKALDLETRSQFEAAIHLYEATGWKRGPDPRNACDRTYLLSLE